MRALLRIIFTLGLVLLFISLLFYIFLPEPISDVRLVSLTQKTIKDDIEVIASIKSEQYYTLYSPLEGTISNLEKEIGGEVYYEQVLAVIKKDEDELTDSQDETHLSNLVTQHSLAIQQDTAELARLNRAVNAGVLPRFKLDEVLTRLELSKEKRVAAEKELNSYKRDKHSRRALSRKKTVIKALSNGIIAKVATHDGQWIRKGDPILEIISTDELNIRAMMTPKQASKLILGQEVIVSKQNSRKNWLEKIIRISSIISQDPNTKNLQKVSISLVNSGKIKTTINERVKIKIKSRQSDNNSLTLPVEAIIRDGKKKFYILYVSRNKQASLGEIYNKMGFISALKQLKCQFSGCSSSVYGLSKKYVTVGNSDLNRVQINQDLASNVKIVIPKVGMDETSLVILDNY